jgi:squalene synthase HpnC
MQSAAVMGRASGENFPVASRVLPRRMRSHLLALYGFARLVDEIGDSTGGAAGGSGVVSLSMDAPPARTHARAGTPKKEHPPTWKGLSPEERLAVTHERLDGLDELERDLDRAFEGRAEHPLLRRLQPTLRECELPRGPFVRLIEANRMDQRVAGYETWEQLRGYCELSANPVGELVLGVFGAATPARVELSDKICTALQLAEHCQDVAEDRDLGRVYLPVEDLERFGCAVGELSEEHAGASLRAVLGFEVARARGLLADGTPLIDELPGVRERLAVGAFVAGGRAALDAIERAGFDVLPGPPRAGHGRRLLALGGTLLERQRERRRGRRRGCHR